MVGLLDELKYAVSYLIGGLALAGFHKFLIDPHVKVIHPVGNSNPSGKLPPTT